MSLRTLSGFGALEHFMSVLMGSATVGGAGLVLFGLYCLLSQFNFRQLTFWGTVLQIGVFITWNVGYALHKVLDWGNLRAFVCPCNYETKYPLLEWYHRCTCLSFIMNGNNQ